MINAEEILAHFNHHERDNFISFYEPAHRYDVLSDPDGKYTSITTFVKNLFEPFNASAVIDNIMNSSKWNSDNKYWGMTKKEITDMWAKSGKDSANAGTQLHLKIEHFLNNFELFQSISNYTHRDLIRVVDIGGAAVEWGYFIQFVLIILTLSLIGLNGVYFMKS